MVSGRMKDPSKANPFLCSREGHLKCSLPYYNLVFCLIVFGRGVFLFGSVFDVTCSFVPNTMFDVFGLLVVILVYYFSVKPSISHIIVLKSCLSSSEGRYFLSKDGVNPSVIGLEYC